MEDGELVAVVLEEPELRTDLELEAVRRCSCVASALVPLGDTVTDEARLSELRQHRLGVRDLELPGLLEVEALDDAVVDQHRIAP